jgi:hypothetical protein
MKKLKALFLKEWNEADDFSDIMLMLMITVFGAFIIFLSLAGCIALIAALFFPSTPAIK